MAAVDVLLACYNGEAYLRQQLDSLLWQDFRDLRIIARDDGSRDATPAILAEYARRHPGRVALLGDGAGNLGVIGNFNRLAGAATAPYVAFCDQDDVWKRGKISHTLEAMRAAETRPGPVLAHTDAVVVDRDLRPISPSLWRHEGSSPSHASRLGGLLLQNVVTGCTAMANRLLMDLAFPVPAEAMMHDWWLALTATAFGRIAALRERTMLYRQHGASVVGAKAFRPRDILAKALRLRHDEGHPLDSVRPNLRQAQALLDHHGARLEPGTRRIVEDFVALPRAGAIGRRALVLRRRFLRVGWTRNLGWLARI
jgi:glycosyltransferase involved in cell wall biosynthesis